MTHYELKLFLLLAETLNFARASEAGNISPSALSRSIKRLEEEAGIPLFLRDNRSVELTEAGKNFRTYAKQVLTGLQDFKDSLPGGRLRGEISMYCSVTASYSILPDLLRSFREAYPDIHFKLQTGDPSNSLEKVAEGEVDLCVAALPSDLPPGLDALSLVTTGLRFIGPAIPCPVKDIIDTKPLAWEKLPLILADRGMERQRVLSWYKIRQIPPSVYARVTGNEAVLAMVSLGLGIGAVPDLVIEKRPVQAEVAILPVKPELEAYEVALCVQRKRLALPQVKAFWESALAMKGLF